MRQFIWLLFILILSVFIGTQIVKDPGLAFFSYGHWSLEMPLWFAILSLIIILLALYGLIVFLFGIENGFSRIIQWFRLRKKYKAYNKTHRGLIEMIEGHWKKAEISLKEGIPQSDAPLINYLALAKAAHEQGFFDKRDQYLREAHQHSPEADLAIGLTQAQLQFNQKQFEQALASLKHLQHIAPNQPLVLKLLEKLYIHLADWESLILLSKSLYKNKVLTREQAFLLEKNAYIELIKTHKNLHEPLKTTRDLWQKIPKNIQKNPQVIEAYCKQLFAFPDASDEIESLIKQSLKKNWDKELINLYGLLNTHDTKKQLSQAETWLKQYPPHAYLYLSLGRICLRCQLWGKARSYFEDSLVLEKNPETYLAYGKLLEQLNDLHSAMQNYKEAIAYAIKHYHQSSLITD